jgi:hypothetical protein
MDAKPQHEIPPVESTWRIRSGRAFQWRSDKREACNITRSIANLELERRDAERQEQSKEGVAVTRERAQVS